MRVIRRVQARFSGVGVDSVAMSVLTSIAASCGRLIIAWGLLCPSLLVASGAASPSLQALREAPSSSAQVNYQVLIYDATVAGATAGTATVAVMRDTSGYKIIGQAKALGLWDALSPWRSHFRAWGTWDNGLPAPTQFQYSERGRNKSREVRVSEGELHVEKNGRERPQRPALPGLDILAALFSSDRCEASLQLHTGRHGYRLYAQTEAASEQSANCAYRVVDEDEESFATRIQYVQMDGLRVPKRIEVSGAISGVLLLRESSLRNGHCGAELTAPMDYFCGAVARLGPAPAPS